MLRKTFRKLLVKKEVHNSEECFVDVDETGVDIIEALDFITNDCSSEDASKDFSEKEICIHEQSNELNLPKINSPSSLISKLLPPTAISKGG